MAAPGPAFPGQPGRCAGHHHPAADPGNRPPTTRPDAARRPVRIRLQPPAATIPRAGSRHRQHAGMAGTRVAAGHQLSDPQVIRAALDGLCTRLDGSPAAANTIARKRAAFLAATQAINVARHVRLISGPTTICPSSGLQVQRRAGRPPPSGIRTDRHNIALRQRTDWLIWAPYVTLAPDDPGVPIRQRGLGAPGRLGQSCFVIAATEPASGRCRHTR